MPETQPEVQPEIIHEMGDKQEGFPKEDFGARVKRKIKPVVNKTPPKIKTAAKWAAGLAGAGLAGKLIYWLGWGEGGSGIYGGEGPLRGNTTATPELENPYDPKIIISKLEQAYLQEGMGGPQLQIPQVDELEHINNPSAQTMAAEAGGPGWMLPVNEVEGKQKLPANANFLAAELAKQLPGVSGQEILSNWIYWHNNPQEFLEFLELHGTPHEVIDWYNYAIDLKAHDLSPNEWQDRLEGLQSWQNSSKLVHEQKLEGREDIFDDEDFEEVVDVACAATGIDPIGVRGSMETVAICGGDATEMVESFVPVPDVHTSIYADMETYSASYILVPLYLLRVGHDMTRGFLGKIKKLLDKQEYRQMLEGLKTKGKEIFNLKVNQ